MNGAMAAAAVAVGAFVAARPTVWGAVALGAASAMAASGAANALNDALDLDVDRKNRPDRPIPAGRVGRRAAVRLALSMYAVAVLAAVPLGASGVALAAAWVAATVLYSTSLKGVPVAGNVVVAAVAASPLLMGGVSQGVIRRAVVPFALAFLVHLAREAVKDAEDRPGDALAGLRTLAVTAGPGACLALARVALVAAMWAAVAPFALRLFGWGYVVLLVPIEAALAWLVIALGARQDAHGLRRASGVLKAVMAAGLLAFAAGVY